jgi:hydrogenase maturation protein HypF
MSEPEPAHEARRIEIVGQVQGVGFRPFVARLACAQGLTGWVLNNGDGVRIHAQGDPTRLHAFETRLRSEAPPASVILGFQSAPTEPERLTGFRIAESELRCGVGGAEAHSSTSRLVIAPDLTICPTCLSEVNEPGNRRHGYALNSCTDCGPRFTIQRDAPFDRPRTTMADFSLCIACAAEYADPGNRRFHAQNTGCPQCGPRLWLERADGSVEIDRTHVDDLAVIERTAVLLKVGAIVAVKGIGGFHLFCDATSADAVQQLRARKKRDRKPFAVLFADRRQLEAHAVCTEDAWELLNGPVTPIVLLDRRPSSTLAEAVAPGLPSVGAMLPSNAIQALLLKRVAAPLVATSGNLTDEPIPIDNATARRELAGLADAFLMHNRRILRQADDSVMRRWGGHAVPVRIGRGLAPRRLEVQVELPPMLAAGGHMKAALAISRGRELFLGPHLGDLDTPTARRRYRESAEDLCRLLGVRPESVVHDAHPDYDSTRFAGETGLPRISVQHHHAHVLSCLAEHGETGPALGVAFDGTGYGNDGSIWGGEFLAVERGQWRRVGSLWPFALPGGDRAAREPRRAAIGVCVEAGAPWPEGDGFSDGDRALIRSALGRHAFARRTTSAGRLFDAWAALVGSSQVSSYEAEAALRIEALAETVAGPVEPFEPRVVDDHGLLRLDWRGWVAKTQRALAAGNTPARLAARFHEGLAAGILEVARRAAIGTVVLSGGCFLNRRLSERTVALLADHGFRVLTHRRIPPGDGGLAIGQLWAAGLRLAN